jgi:hypothetical protein
MRIASQVLVTSMTGFFELEEYELVLTSPGRRVWWAGRPISMSEVSEDLVLCSNPM